MHSAVRLFTCLMVLLAIVAFASIAFLFIRHHTGADKVEAQWSDRKIAPVEFDTTARSVSITPLVNWHASDNRFATEAGVSLLIETDRSIILFDVGYNQGDDAISPLQHNAKLMGQELANADLIFLSHRHRDHMGGVKAERDGQLALEFIADGDNTPVVSPTALQAETRPVTQTFLPTRIGPGIATTGPIGRHLFMGRVDEQALIINLEGHGLVVIVGCGHQTVEKLVRRIEETFKEPIYAIVGDLHFPVPEGRLSFFGIDAQRYFASGESPFDPVRWRDVHGFADWAETNRVSLFLGGHDTSDEVLSLLEDRFKATFKPLRVGEPQCLGC